MISFRSLTVVSMLAAVAVPIHGISLPGLPTQEPQSLPAIVKPIRAVDVAAHVDGAVAELMVREGQEVLAEQTLARIDDRIPAAQVNVARAAAECEAGVRLAESELRQAQRHLARMQAAFQREAVAEAELDRAVADFELAEARLLQSQELCRQRQQQLNLERARLETHLLLAPFDGQVLRIESQTGEEVEQGTAIVRVADLSRLRAVLHVPFAWFQQVQVGQELRLNGAAPVYRRVAAEVVSVEPAIDAATETFRCVVEIENPQRDLPAGFSVSLQQDGLSAQPVRSASAGRPESMLR